MIQWNGIKAIWYREFKVFTREKSRVVSSLLNPILWLLIMGGGLGSSISIANVNYQTFIFPGIMIMAVAFTCVFYGTYIIWDKKVDFLKEVLVAPLSRTTVFLGKVVGGSTDTFIEGLILVALSLLFGIKYSPFTALGTVGFLLLSILSMVSLGLIIGSMMESPEGFNLIITFVLYPMVFLSGAFYPIDNLPSYLAIPSAINPLTYGVDGIRGMMIGLNHFPLTLDLLVMVGFSVIAIIAGGYAFSKMKV